MDQLALELTLLLVVYNLLIQGKQLDQLVWKLELKLLMLVLMGPLNPGLDDLLLVL